MLRDWGYDTLSAASGEEALDLAAQEDWRFDAIIADHRLGPGLTGNAAAKEIARRAGRPFPTLLVTGDTARERLTEVSSSGFALLHKPVAAEELRRTLASLERYPIWVNQSETRKLLQSKMIMGSHAIHTVRIPL